MKIGLLINPIAGVGAALAWKGTDDVENAWKAVKNGAIQPVWEITNRAISSIPSNVEIEWVLAANYPVKISGKILSEYRTDTTRDDTIKSIQQLLDENVEMIVFVGGDGTASDISSTDVSIPCIGIPGGVKIFSTCFLHRPEDLGSLLVKWEGETIQVDILDLDEASYKQGRPDVKLVGTLQIPLSPLIQAGKTSWSITDTHTFELIAQRIRDQNMLDNTLLVGPGSTMYQIFKSLGIEKTLLGVDVIENGKLVRQDCTRSDLQELVIDEIWVTPIGLQGHIFGRGNRQIPPSLIASVGKKGIKIFSSPEKMQHTPVLYVDTGDISVDMTLKGYIRVITGYHEEVVKKVI